MYQFRQSYADYARQWIIPHNDKYVSTGWCFYGANGVFPSAVAFIVMHVHRNYTFKRVFVKLKRSSKPLSHAALEVFWYSETPFIVWTVIARDAVLALI